MKKLLFILLLCIQATWAQVQFEAKVSKEKLGINERLRVDFSMNADGDNFVPPSFDGFRVIAGPSQQVSQSWINGKSSFQKAYSYYLMPTQRGVLTIRQAQVEINGQIYKTTPIKVTVTGAVEQPRDPNDTQISANDALHLVAEVSKTDPYLNEPITVVYKLYFSYNIGITNWRELDKPKYNDFWSQNIDIKQLKVEEGRYNGERYRYVVLRKTVLYPQKSGRLNIEPLSLDIDVELPSNRRTIFGQVIAVQDNKRVSAGAKTINVRPLPEAGKPADFTGAVGKFDFKVTPSKTTLNSGESLDLTVSVSGTGNLKLFNLPKPVVPASLEMYEPVRKENVSTPLSGMTGSISDSYTLIPQSKGKFPIKGMSFSYFNPATGRYTTLTAPEIMVNVTGGPVATTAPSATPNKVAVADTEQFKFIKLETQLTPMEEEKFLGSGLFFALVGLPFLAIPIIVALRRRKEAADRDVHGKRIRTNDKLARKFLQEAKASVGDKGRFYVNLEKAMHNFLKARLRIETTDLSKDRIREILNGKARPESVDVFMSLMESCEMARYAPSSQSLIDQDYERAVKAISELEKQLS